MPHATSGGTPRFIAAVLALAAWLATSVIPLAAAAELQPSLLSGTFGDERLILSADRETGLLSGYYRDGDCRVFLTGALRPVIQYQRPGLGESYEVESWDPRAPRAVFTTILYSRARGGFDEQITLEPGGNDAGRPAACRWRVSLDRAGHVSHGLIGAAVIAKSRPRLYELEQDGAGLRLVPRGRAALGRDTGVWITRTYGASASRPGMVRITWYDPPGTPRGGYVRERDLHPVTTMPRTPVSGESP